MVARNYLIVVLVGETASGKSEAAMKIAEHFKGEIINADSWTVYKGFNIGTAKPSTRDRSKVKHHLIDVAEPRSGYNAALFKRQASEVIEDVLKRNRLPIIVGGTGLYVDSLLYSYSFLPTSGDSYREKLNKKSLEELQSMIQKRGYSVEGIDMNNKRRLIRLLENKGRRPTSGPLREDMVVFGLRTERDQLRQNVRTRVDKMFRRGLRAEVSKLSEMYGWDIEPMKGIGYREFREYMEGSINLEETKQKIVKDTMDLAKKQRTWFARNKSIHWVSNSDQIVDILTTFLNK